MKKDPVFLFSKFRQSHFFHKTKMDEETKIRFKNRELPYTIPQIIDPETQIIVYQNKYYPWKLRDIQVYSRIHGLGFGFEKWSQNNIVEFLDDYLECKDILTLGTTSKEWNFFCSSEKYFFKFALKLKF